MQHSLQSTTSHTACYTCTRVYGTHAACSPTPHASILCGVLTLCIALLLLPAAVCSSLKQHKIGSLNSQRVCYRHRSAMSLRLKDHVALITGASRGIGRASAIALAAEGAKIVGVARTKAELDTLVAQITSTGGAAIAVVADVTKSADVARSVKEAVDAFGRVDILVNNVGMGGYRPFLEWSEEDYDRIMATNAKSSWLYAREIIPVMRKNGAAGGQIINVSSVAGLQAYPNEIIYCMSKAAQQALTQGLDREFFRENIKLLPL